MKKLQRFVITMKLWVLNEFKMNWNELRCQSERMCIHVGFYVIIVHAIARKEVSTLTPQMDLSLVPESTYEGAIGSAICSNSDPYDLLLTYRFLSKDLWIFSGWCGGYPTWDSSMICGASAICLDLTSVRIFWKDSENPGGACLSPSYTSDWLF
jgi:hypothetical protein